MRTLSLIILAILAPLSSALAQDEQKLEYVFPHQITVAESKRLLKALAYSPQIPISFNNADRSPLTLVAASVSAVRRYQPDSPTMIADNYGEYALDARITTVNKTGRRTKALKLEFIDESPRTRFELEDRIAVDPYGSSIFGDQQNDAARFISLPVRPGQLSVKVLEVEFEDGTIWGLDSPDVDETPAPLNRPQPTYTEEAQRNHIQGSVRLRLLVAADGKVTRVKLIRGLPYGLDEEAIQTAYSLRLKPAMKAGKPVECWQVFEIEYRLPRDPWVGSVWGADSTTIDERPEMLTRPQANYTEEALRSRVQGSLRLRLLAGVSGEVKRVEIIRGLPYGLDDQAIHTAFGLRFKPAMKAGKPVECWLSFEIDYKLPGQSNLVGQC